MGRECTTFWISWEVMGSFSLDNMIGSITGRLTDNRKLEIASAVGWIVVGVIFQIVQGCIIFLECIGNVFGMVD